MILALLFGYLGYRKAEATGRSKGLWVFLMIVIFLGVQVLTGLLIGLVIGIGVGLWGWSPYALETYYWQLNILGVLPSAGVCGAVLYFLGRNPVGNAAELAPPPPPTFESE